MPAVFAVGLGSAPYERQSRLMAQLDYSHPSIDDLRRKAKARLPKFAFDYLDSGTGAERAKAAGRAAMERVQFRPAILQGPLAPTLSTQILGKEAPLPIGIAPVGMAGMIWPGAEATLAKAAVRHSIPYCQSTVACATPEETGPLVGEQGWYQFYPAHEERVWRDMLARIRAAGFHTLVMTVDVVAESRRERQRRAYLGMPPKITPQILWWAAQRPAWSLSTLRHGLPRLPFPESYVPQGTGDKFTHAGRVIRGWPDWKYLEQIRAAWDGPLVIKGVQSGQDARRLVDAGADAIWVSGHAYRQFEGAPPPITVLPSVRDAVPGTPVFYDTGVEGGLDIMRAVALGADAVFLGKAFYFALAAFGDKGVDHLVHLLREDLRANMGQIGARDLADVACKLADPQPFGKSPTGS